MSAHNLLFFGTYADKNHLSRLKEVIQTTHQVFLITQEVNTWTELKLYCAARNIHGIISTSQWLLIKLLGREDERKRPSVSNYAGSLFKRDGIEIVFTDPIEQLLTIPYGKFLAERFISKLTKPDSWSKIPDFKWEILNATNFTRIFADYQSAFLIAIDIETFKENLTIRCVGFTACFYGNDGSIRTHSCVLALDSTFNLAIARKFCWELTAPKVTQNGKYDISYCFRYNIILRNWLFDTATMFHAWYSELPKDLGFLGAFFVREAMYWKDLSDTTDLHQYYEYNCRDHWTTALVAITWILSSPEWAKQNYLMEFPINFPSLLSEMTGIKRDIPRMNAVRGEVDLAIARKNKSLNTMLGVENFNVNSPIQMKALLCILGCRDIVEGTYGREDGGAGEKNLRKAAFRHPLIARIIDVIVGPENAESIEEEGIRGLRKLKSTYLRTDEDITKTSPGGAKELKGRVLYAINPHGTDTGRNASREHHFWCGLQIQNILRGPTVKQTFVADNEFRFGETDLEQAEARDVAFISGDEKLIAAVEGTRDFHSVNASEFFGKPYDDIYDDAKRKTKDKPLRDLSKRTNHGANYCMGPGVMVDTMGLKRVNEARRLLGLPATWEPKKVTEYLLERFHKTYPRISGLLYPYVIERVTTFRLLVGATGWTRYCFGDPKRNKRHLNSYVAHCGQSLNAMVLNKAYMRVFYEIALPPYESDLYKERAINFKLLAQIHDSILFQFRQGYEHLATLVKECMEIPVTIKGCDGVTRTFTVPAANKLGADGKGAQYWSETEA